MSAPSTPSTPSPPSDPNLYSPSDLHVGGQLVSYSYFRTWATCQLEWALRYLVPHPDHPAAETAGMEAVASGLALGVGKSVHVGLQAYRLSGWANRTDTGVYSLPDALTAALDYYNEHVASTLGSEEEQDKGAEQITFCLSKYDATRAPDDDWHLASDPDGVPYTEREFQLPLCNGRYILAAVVDAIGIDNQTGHVQPVEYKTSSYQFANPLILGFRLIGQSAGTLGIVQANLLGRTDLKDINGVRYEVLVKDRGRKSDLPAVERPAPIWISRELLAKWFADCETWAQEIDWKVALYRERISASGGGMDPYTAALKTFAQSGRANGQCVRYRRLCDYAAFCETHRPTGLLDLVPRSLLNNSEETQSLLLAEEA